MNSRCLRKFGFSFFRSMFLMGLAMVMPVQAQVEIAPLVNNPVVNTPLVILENQVTVTVDPQSWQEVVNLRPGESVVPPTPDIQVTGVLTQSPAILVQRSGLGLAWYQLDFEGEVVAALLELHGLAPDQRSRMLRWERDEVRAGCYRRLLAIINKSNRNQAEQQVYDAMTATLKATIVQATEESLRQYNVWSSAPHLFVPPPPFKYALPPPAKNGLFHLLGGPKPPTFDEFKQYGVAVVFAGAGGNGELERIIRGTATRSVILGSLSLGNNNIGATVASAIALALPSVVTNIVLQVVTRVVIPLTIQTYGVTASVAASAFSAVSLGASVVGAVVGVVVTSVFEGIAVTDAAQVPIKLAEAVTNARNMTVNLNGNLTTEAGIAQLYTAFLKTTLPDFAATEPAPPALATDQQWLTASAGTTWFRPTPALQMQAFDGAPISVRLLDGWFVVRDQTGKEIMTLNLEYLGAEGQLQTLTKLASGFYCTDATGDPSGCAQVGTFSFRNWNNQPRLAKLGSGGVQAVITQSALNDGRVGVPFSQGLSIISPGTGAYAYSLITDGPGLPPGLVLSMDGTLSGTPTSAGTFVFDVYATNPGGSHPAQQRLTLHIDGDPVPAPANSVNSWLFENNALDTVGTAHGTWSGTPGYVTGWVGKAATFSGANFIELPQNVFPTGARSFETWFRTNGPGVVLGQQGVNTGYVPAIYVDINGKLRVSFFWNGTLAPLTSAASVNNGQWHHVAATHDGSNQRVYLDGALISATANTQVPYDTGYRYFLGYGPTGGWPNANNGYFTGEIDESAIYSRALSGAEVSGLFAAGAAGKANLTLGSLATTGEVGSYRLENVTVQRNGAAITNLSSLRVVSGALPHGLSLDAASATISGIPRSVGAFTFSLRATDATGHSGDRSYTMTISGPWRPRPDGLINWWPGEGNLTNRVSPANPLVSRFGGPAPTFPTGLVGQAFGNTSYVVMPTFPNLGISGITVETWFQTSGESVILCRRPTGLGAHTPVLWVGRDGFVRADFSQPASVSLSRPLTGTFRVDDGGWHHVALSFDGTEQRLHVDGLLVGIGRGLSTPGIVFARSFSLGGGETFLPGWPGLPDGANLKPFLPVDRFDEPALYGRVLTTAEINGVFASGSRGKPALLVNESTVPAVTFGIPYRQILTAQGATGAVAWSITGGGLPEGLSLSPAGIISGMLARTRSAAVTIQVTDSTGAVGVRDFVITAQGTPAPLPFGAVAWWRGDLNPNDSVGTRHGIPLSSGPTYRSGSGGNAFFFNRAGSSLALPTGAFPAVDTFFGSNTPYSFETWFLTDRPGVILGRRDFASPLLPLFFKPALYVGTDGRLHSPMFEVERTGTPPASSQRVDDGKFHHVAVTYDGGNLRLFLDGVLQGPVITNATSRFGSLVDTLELGTGFTGSLGSNWPATTGGWMSFYGYIDEPATYNRALTEAEIGAINQAGEFGKTASPVINVTLPAGRIGESYLADAYPGQSGVVFFGGGEMPPGLLISSEGIVSGIPESAGFYQFKGGVRQSDGTFLNYQYILGINGVAASPVGLAGWYSGQGNLSGHLAGETAVAPSGVSYAAGQVGQAFSFDGVAQHLVMSNVPFPAPSGEWSFETWFRTTAGGVILGQRDIAGNYVPMLYVGSGGLLHSAPYWSDSVSTLTSTDRVDDGIFHHAVFTYANGVRSLFLDGELVAAETRPGVSYAAAYSYQIGTGLVANWPSAPANRFFTGQIDEPQFYNRALDAAEARRGFTAGKFGRSVIVMDNTLTGITASTGSYSGQVIATGGNGPYTYAVTEGRLPEGITLSPQGQLTGAITHSSGTFDFAIEATPASGAKSIRDYQIIVQPNVRYRPAGVLAWWPAEGNADDWTGNHNAQAFGSLPGFPYGYGDGIVGQSFSFRGLGVRLNSVGLPIINEGVLLPKSAFPALGQRGPFSLEMWFRATQPGGILGQSNLPVLGNYGLPMLYIDTAGYLRTQIGWTSTPNPVVSPGIVLDNTWHHVAATLDAAGLMQVYLDGVLIGTRSGIGPVLENSQAEFILGHVSANGWPFSGDSLVGVTFAGQIDEASTWTRVLTQDEILRLLACGPNGKATRTITPGGTLPTAIRNVNFTQPLTVTGQGNPRFTLASGSLPPGIFVSTADSVNPPVSGLFGTPASTGFWEFILRNIPPVGPLASTELVDESFTLTADPSSAYRDWANTGGGLQGPARLPSVSPFADSVNLLKYAFNLNPTASDLRLLSTGIFGLPSITRDASGRLVIEFIRRRSATDPSLSYVVVTGSELTDFSTLNLDDAVITPIDSTWERVKVIDPALTPKRFGRVNVIQN